MVQRPRVEEGTLRFDLAFTSQHTKQDRSDIQAAVVANLRELGVTGDIQPFARLVMPKGGTGGPPKPKAPPVKGMEGGGMQPHGGAIHKKTIPGVKHIVAVASGKGGVGKSTIASNLAVGLTQFGHKVGMMDADVYGPSLPTMMNVHTRPVVNKEKRIQPVVAHGVKCISIGLVVDPEEAIIWRGPMIMGLLRQFIQDTDWGELDYLIVDLPPGTGDAQLSLIQAVPLAGAVIVTTPQDIALADAIRGISMFRKLDVPLLGLVENMAYYPLPDGTRDYVFGQDGGKRAAEKYATELLAEIPLQTAIRKAGDDGTPAVLGSDELAHNFSHIAKRITEKLPTAAE
ncbi:MAG: Mrp/NBP35 family ATP-binding protein [Proteobacteria bacterium]|nr:Mrp/NBP35 family ATP-binding protein [Pseudomonadota bacterium]